MRKVNYFFMEKLKPFIDNKQKESYYNNMDVNKYAKNMQWR